MHPLIIDQGYITGAPPNTSDILQLTVATDKSEQYYVGMSVKCVAYASTTVLGLTEYQFVNI